LSLKNYKFEDLLEGKGGWVPRSNPPFDVLFSVLLDSGEPVGEVQAHKLLLALVSPVFKDTFFNNDNSRDGTCSRPELDELEIKGYSLLSFKYFIRYLYTGRTEDFKDLQLDHLFQLYLLADHYQVRGMKDVVRLSIKAAEIDVNTDIFKVLVKYDDHYILENVCTDIYRKCVQSIRDKCNVDNLSYSDYIEQISGDDLDIQNIVVKRLKVELDALDKEVETENALMMFERKLKEAEERKNFDITELKEGITELREDTEKKLKDVEERKNSDIIELREDTEKKLKQVEERKNSDITELKEGITELRVDTEKKLKEVEERKNSDITELRENTEKKLKQVEEVSFLKRKLEEINVWKAKKSCEMEELKKLAENAATKYDFEDMKGRLTDRENTIFKCENCKFVDCKNGRDIEILSTGMKVRSKIAHEGQQNGLKISIPENAEGIVNAWPQNITWKLLGGVNVSYLYDFDRSKVAYKCK